MLGFLKKYQKIFFVFVALLVGVSVMLVGLLPRNLSSAGDKTLFKAVTGKKIKRSHYEGLKALLSTNNGEMALYGQNLGMNFFLEDAFTQNIIQPKLMGLIAQKKQDELAPLWKEQHEKEKLYKSYAHPQAAHVSADSVWHKHAPQIPELLEKLQNETDLQKAFTLRTELFLEENQFSPFALWQFLAEKQTQYQWLQKDENMAPYSLSLFGYRSLQDWFGPKVMDYACQFILQVSSIAQKRGYQASYKEAENSLAKLNEKCFQQLQFLGLKEFSDAESYFYAKLNRLGMNKVQMVSLWREILTFQNFFNEASHAALLDDLTLEDFEKYASEQVQVCTYMPPEHLRFRSPKDLAQLETYLAALGKPQELLSLNFELNDFKDIEKENPQLIEQRVEIDYKEVDVHQAAISVSVQAIWNWKNDPKNCQELLTRFPKLQIDEKMSPSNYQACFDDLDYFTQMQLDQHIRQTLLKQDENWLANAFEKVPNKNESFYSRKSGYKLPFKGLEISSKKESFLKNFFNFFQEEKALDSVTFDDVHFYKISAVKGLEEPKLVRYEDLLKDKTAEKMLQQALKKEHKKSAFKDQEFAKVKDKVLCQYLEPIQSAILKDFTTFSGSDPKQLNEIFYCNYRLYNPMREALAFYKNSDEENDNVFAFNSFWNIYASTDTLIRHQNNTREMDALLDAPENSWSLVELKNRIPVFTYILSKESKIDDHPMQKQLRSELSSEAIQALATELLDQIELNNYSSHE